MQEAHAKESFVAPAEPHQPLTNADFRKLLATPKPAASSASHQTVASGRSHRGGQYGKGHDKKKKHNYRPFVEEKDELLEILNRYRDRAKERREGELKENEEEINALANSTSYRSVAPTLRGTQDLAERRKRIIEESKYLGGDMEHTHLVKGLDYALLQKVRSEIDVRGKGDHPEKLSVTDSTKTDVKEEKLTFRTKLAKNIYNVLQYKPPKVNELFAPRRMAYIVDLGQDDEGNDADIPTVLLRSKQECPMKEVEMSVAVNDVVIQKLTEVLSEVRTDGRRKKKDRGGKDFMQICTQVVIYHFDAESEDQANERKKESIASADIYEGIGDYVPPVLNPSSEKESLEKHRKNAQQERDSAAKDNSTLEVTKPSSSFNASSELPATTDMQKRKEDIRDSQDARRESWAGQQARGIKLGIGSSVDSYAECYPGGLALFDAAGDSDDEADYSKMDLGNKKGLIRRWDFDTEQEYEAYMSSREAMPRAAFQYGVKMNDGRKTRKLPRGKNEKDEKAKLDRQWQKISQILSKRKESGTSTLATFLKLLIRWKGSIYKLMYKEAIIYLSLYTILSLVYRFALNSEQREQFEKLSLFCEKSLSFIPLTFILGFYVSMVVTRWWDVFMNIGWPDRIVLQVACYVQSADQKGRMIRRTVARYLNLAQTLVLRDISSAVKKRFPTMDMVIQSGIVYAGFMNEEEHRQYEEVQCLHHKFWIPIQWCCTLLHKARKESLIENDLLLNQLIDDIMNYRQNLMMLLNYDWISVPLVYTQVVTIAVYGFFAASLMARQYLDPDKHYPGHIVDLYVPIFTILQFVFYMGWLKVAESLINPLGEDDDDFEINYIVERNLQAGYLICDENYGRIPPLERDIHWNDVQAEIPHTAASLGLKDNPQIGSASTIEVKPEKAELVPSDTEEAKQEEGLSRFRKVSRAIMEGARRQFLRNNSQEFSERSPSITGSGPTVSRTPSSAACLGRRKISRPLSHSRPPLDFQFSRSNSQRSSRRSVGKKPSIADGPTRESPDYNHLSPPAEEWPKTSPRDSCRSTPSPIRLETISEGNSRVEEDASVGGESPSPPPRGTSASDREAQRHTSNVDAVAQSPRRPSSSSRDPTGQDNPIFVVEDQDDVFLPSQACRYGIVFNMKLLKKDFDKDGAGYVTLLPEETEDMWHAYNLIQEKDNLRASAVRKVTNESATGSTSSYRVRTSLTVTVERVDFDSQTGALHIKGRNIEENQYVKVCWSNWSSLGCAYKVLIFQLGAYHTLDLELNRKFTIYKSCWDVVHIERIEEACNIAQHADLAAVVMQDGLAHVCLITPSMTIVRAKIDLCIPRKRRFDTGQHDKGVTKFYDSVMQAIVRHFDFNVIKCVLVASPGFVREQFCKYMFERAAAEGNKALLDNKDKFLLVHSTSGFKHALKEVLADPQVSNRLMDTKATGEIKALETFFNLLVNEPQRAFYGIKHVELAAEAEAIETLLITDTLFRSTDFAKRRRYVDLVESAKEQNADVKIFSSLHGSGEQLAQLGGVAAILRFPMAEIEDEDQLDSDEAPED
ncbi:hypothetical protein M513_07072 [Trichuris suis]|uniref:eRF1/Pelota-like N-terminal domain-containing protein n=1 Tax=Trichuris suis TaxID=68888 RepID=A0A085M4E4_9BILA|nr:hypothetical protein M513_07072 [Trichuris suis]